MNFQDMPGTIWLENGRCRFHVWAPHIDRLDLHLVSPDNRTIPLVRDPDGDHSVVLDSIKPGFRYFYRLDRENEYPDPASRYQPEGVHGPSQVVSPHFSWKDSGWQGIPLKDYVIYELHTGSFTPEGTFQAVIPFLDELKDLGISAIELMPVAQFPGERNWGYDGVFPFAVQNSYGGPEGLKLLVDACHQRGLAFILDVVYNHLGPEGNYFDRYGPYFTGRYNTPWGKALNYDGPFSDGVRRFFIQNAVYWISEFQLDALRLDALHAILDISARPFLAELSTSIGEVREKLKRQIYLIAESDANDRRVIIPSGENGLGMDAQWNDDFQHSLHAVLTGERDGYYRDFGEMRHLAKALSEGFVYSGQYSEYRKRRFGSPSGDITADKFVVFAQNHDQVGNRMLGERLNALVSFEKLKLAAALVCLSPYIPLLFMGQEYAETAPFQYFINHSDQALIEAVRRGRRQEFAAFISRGEVPDPQDRFVFLGSKLDHGLKESGPHRVIYGFYRELLRMRREIPALSFPGKENMEVLACEDPGLLYLRRWYEDSEIVLLCNFADKASTSVFALPHGKWEKILDSDDEKWLGRGGLLPQELFSTGDLGIALEPCSCLLLSRIGQEV
ncbi:MAG: malto-oligosyltrehalose trehalohydrolase [Dehalococcoidales bacterium]|nr:malto-oligosyltrehalose trehalohydrolase [Dehalococcoidales bacterium]